MASPVSPRYSTLELVKDDATAGAPQRDHAAVAPEGDQARDAPQTAPVHDPQIRYSDIPPEAVIESEDGATVRETIIETPQKHKISRQALVVVSVLVTAIIIGIAVGTGVGVGIKQKRASSSSIGDNVRTLDNTLTRTTGPKCVPRHPTSSVNVPFTNKQLLNGTSLAALELPNGDRRVFFQEASGVIRQASYSLSTRTWSADVTYGVASDAKNYTPITGMVSLQTVNAYDRAPFIFYITANNSLACLLLGESGADSWTSCSDPQPYSGLENYTAAVGSRYLSVAGPANQSGSDTLLLFEPPYGGLALLNGNLGDPLDGIAVVPNDPFTMPWIWKNASSNLRSENDTSNAQLGAPFTAIFVENEDDPQYAETIFANHHEGTMANDLESLQKGCVMGEFTLAHPDYGNHQDSWSSCGPGYGIGSLADVDILLIYRYGIVVSYLVNETKLTSLGCSLNYGPSLKPSTPFPFTRLAGFNQANSLDFFVYHQLNSTALAEEQ